MDEGEAEERADNELTGLISTWLFMTQSPHHHVVPARCVRPCTVHKLKAVQAFQANPVLLPDTYKEGTLDVTAFN